MAIICFSTQFSGDLTVEVHDHTDFYLYRMNFPSRPPALDQSTLPAAILQSLSHPPTQIYKASRDYLLLYDNEEDILNLSVKDRALFDSVNLDPGGVCVTAPASSERRTSDSTVSIDFVSRFFTPQASILEDPVTGSAHCTLIPFWAQRLQKNLLVAQQVSQRLGTLSCELDEDRVWISGRAQTYLTGTIAAARVTDAPS